MKITAILIFGVSLPLLAGCTNSFSRVADALNTAPGWYAERRAEIRGEGYPQIVNVPVLGAGAPAGSSLGQSTARAGQIAAMFDADPLARSAAGGEAEIREIADRIRQAFSAAEPEARFLTEADIMAIRESFNVPRVTSDVY